MHARLRDYRPQAVALNAWTLTQSATGLGAVAAADPGEPSAELQHVLAGAGAVGSALLLTLWACQHVSGTISAADTDPKGVDVSNLNRCVPFHRTDLSRPKAIVSAERLSGHHGLTIEPYVGKAENLVGPRTHLISAIDTPEARQALQDAYPASTVQASTSGLRLEMLRVDPKAGTACLRCFNPPRAVVPDSRVRAQIADMDEATVMAHAEAIGADAQQVREWARTGGCGEIGDALLERLRPSDGRAAQFSVGFISVLAGVLLAGQVLKDAVRRPGNAPDLLADDVPLLGENARFVMNLIDPSTALAGVRRYGRDSECPACQGVRADVWAKRWTG
ncbi:ThiF family adenylyltransferase [Nonomuraea sp. NPDC050404]|uniref:ThiF family adenylyltransferase n=1 Tax=Nonomuraea sp. NPDC050404 TaxID=3155783 RepID=UPI0033E871F8